VISSVFVLFFGYTHFRAGPCCHPQKYRLIVDLISTDKKLATKQDRQTLQTSDEKQYCHSYIAQHTALSCCYCTDKGPDVCIFARFKENYEVMPRRSFANFKLRMSRHKKE